MAVIQPATDVNTLDVEQYEWTEDARQFVSDNWREFWKAYQLKNEGLDLLGGRTLQEFWDESNRDYAVENAAPEDENDPVKQYQSTISRDKSDVFIANLTGQLMYPDVIAQNPEQEIDMTVGRVGSSLLYWAYKQDGWPSENGEQKTARYVHKMVVEGTVHVLDIVDKDGLTSELIPNEEIYVPNYWQPDIQRQQRVYRAKLNVLYDEAAQDFGDMDNWKYVAPQAMDFWYRDYPWAKDGFEGIIQQDRVSILYVWSVATPAQLKELKRQRKVASNTKRACFYNVLINNIPMFDVDNLLAYKDGFYPISKGIFCKLAKAEFYWGNSMPNKIREDKKWVDAWKTLLRYKAKLGLLKPTLVIGGHLDEQIMLPSKMTDVEAGVEVQTVPGVADGITSQDVQLLQMAEGEIDRGTVSPNMSGQVGDNQTARAAVIQATNAEKMLDSFSREISYFMSSRSFPILMRLFQFLPKRSIKKIAVPEQTLDDGLQGTFEIMFKEPATELDEMTALEQSMALRQEMQQSRAEGKPKDIVHLPPSYLREMKFYLFSDAGSALLDKDALRQAQFQRDLPTMLANSDIFDRREVSREYVRIKGYANRLLAKADASPQAPQGSSGGLPIGEPVGPATPDQAIQEQSEQLTGEKLPALPPIM